MIRHNFFLPEDLVYKMKEYSAKTGVTLSEIVRRAIFAWLKEHERV
jgi:predicted DNA-binding protein